VGLLRAFGRKHDDRPMEMLDVEDLRSRIGEPLPPRQPPPPVPGYVRSDGRPREIERSWRKVAGLNR